ncbi:hypothetical protein EMIT0P43_60029 [Pseudomonas jessenii]
MVGACLITMKEAVTTVPRSIPRHRQPITPGGVPTTPMVAVTTHRRPGTTCRQRGITSRHRAITHSHGSINRRAITRSRGCINHRAITSRPLVTISRRVATTARIRTMAGTAVTAGTGTTTIAVTVEAIAAGGAATDSFVQNTTLNVGAAVRRFDLLAKAECQSTSMLLR